MPRLRRPALAAGPSPSAARRTTPPTVDDAVRRRLAQVAQVLIPAGDTMPSADEVDVSDALLDRVLAAVPSLAGALTAGPRRRHRRRGHRPLAGRALRRRPAAYRSLVLAVAGAYYLDPGVRRRLGYEGQVPQPVRPAAFPEYVDEGLLDAVLSNWAGPAGRRQNCEPTSSW